MQDRTEVDARLHRMANANVQPSPPIRDRISARLKELSRLLDNPLNVAKVKAELLRLADG